MQKLLFMNAHDGGWREDDQLHTGRCRLTASLGTDISNII